MCRDCRQWKIVVIMINVITMILTRSMKPFQRCRRRRWRRSGARPRTGTAASRQPSACIPPSFCVAWTQNTPSEKTSWHRYCVFLQLCCDYVIRWSLLLCATRWPPPYCFRAGRRGRRRRRHHLDVRAGPPDNDNEYGIVKTTCTTVKKTIWPNLCLKRLNVV